MQYDKSVRILQNAICQTLCQICKFAKILYCTDAADTHVEPANVLMEATATLKNILR